MSEFKGYCALNQETTPRNYRKWVSVALIAVFSASCITIIIRMSVPLLNRTGAVSVIPSFFDILRLPLNGTIRDDTINRVVFLLWTGTNPLRAVGLATIDSIARHMPHWAVEIHITVEIGIPEDVLVKRKDWIYKQINHFKKGNLNIQAIFHDDIATDLKGTMFDGLGITQKHVGGVYNREPHENFRAHVSDFLRLVLPLDRGGMYMDDDNLLLRDLEPLMERYGPTLLTQGTMFIPDSEKNGTIPSCRSINGTETISPFSSLHECCDAIWPQNCWFSFSKSHPLIVDTARRVRDIISWSGVDCIFPYLESMDACMWTAIGPRILAAAHVEFCKHGFPPPQVVNSVVDDRTFLPNETAQNQLKIQRDAGYSYAIVNRMFLMPGHWMERTFLTDVGNLTERVHRVIASYQFHIYGFVKFDFLDLLRDPEKHPILNVVHQMSCSLLCHPHLYDLILLPQNATLL